MIVKNLWKNTTLLCGCHNEEVKMEASVKHGSILYSCPKCYHFDRNKNETSCLNQINTKDFEKAVDYLSNVIAHNELDNIREDLTGHKWENGGIFYEVVKHEGENIFLKMTNSKAIRR